MVFVQYGVLIECDPAMKHMILHLSETKVLGKPFVTNDLDDNHLFISQDVVDKLQEKIEEHMKSLNYIPNTQK